VTPRPTARVLLVDPSDRLLLMRFTGDAGVVFWAPCGGGVEPGESFEQAAVREVFEETGLRDVALGPQVFDRAVTYTWRGRRYCSQERWFLARVPAFTPGREGWTEAERADVDDIRWWTVSELAASPDALVPLDLARRVAALLADGPPAVPLTLGF
jgi:ADP-ribose pyrophosphatase YjhB (NUDIX family)